MLPRFAAPLPTDHLAVSWEDEFKGFAAAASGIDWNSLIGLFSEQ